MYTSKKDLNKSFIKYEKKLKNKTKPYEKFQKNPTSDEAGF